MDRWMGGWTDRGYDLHSLTYSPFLLLGDFCAPLYKSIVILSLRRKELENSK